MKKSRIESYLEIVKHEMFADEVKTVDKDFIEKVIIRAGGKSNEVEDVINHPSVMKANNGEYFVE